MIGIDIFFVLMGAILVFAMHGGFAFLEVGTVRHKNQVNALVKIIADFAISTVAYFIIGYTIAYGTDFFTDATTLSGMTKPGAPDNNIYEKQGFTLVKLFFLTTFAAAIPAIISGGIAERAKFYPQLIASAIIVGLFYPFFEGIVWGNNWGFQDWLETKFGAPFHDFAGSIVVHAVGGWIALAAVLMLKPRYRRYKNGIHTPNFPPSSIPWLSLGSWLLCVGWFGFNVMSAQSIEGVTGLVALNSLMAMVGGILTALIIGKNDPGFIHNGALAGLVGVCAGSDVMHPIGSFCVGGMGGIIFVVMFNMCQNKWKIDDVLGVWPLHGLCGLWGGIACGIFGLESFGGLGSVALVSQLIGSFLGIVYAFIVGLMVYGLLRLTVGIRLTDEQQQIGADLTIHKIGANPEV